MNALVVDSDTTARVLVRRILMRDLGCDITEVDNGLDALDKLSEKPFGFMLLDPEVPGIDGFQVLEAVRRNAEHESMPVVIMTRRRDETAVRKLAQLGISDYLIKPLQATLIGARLSRLISATGHTNGGRTATDNGKRTQTLKLDSTVLLVDGSAEFRKLFTAALGDRAALTSLGTGVQALKRCKQAAPAAVFVGDELGMLHAELLVAELRRIPAMFESQVVGIVEEALLEQARDDKRWNAVMRRTDQPDTLSEELGRLFDSRRPMSTLARAYPTLKADLSAAAEQVCAMMLSGPVSVRPVSMHDRTGQQRVAAVTITRGEDNLTVTLEIRCSVDSARQLASMVLGVELGIVGKDDIESTLAELANIVAGRLESGLAERDIKVSCGLPMARDEDGASSRPPHDDAIELLVSGEASGVAIAFVMS